MYGGGRSYTITSQETRHYKLLLTSISGTASGGGDDSLHRITRELYSRGGGGNLSVICFFKQRPNRRMKGNTARAEHFKCYRRLTQNRTRKKGKRNGRKNKRGKSKVSWRMCGELRRVLSSSVAVKQQYAYESTPVFLFFLDSLDKNSTIKDRQGWNLFQAVLSDFI